MVQGPELFDLDHVYFDSKAGSPVYFLYGAVGTGCVREFHLSGAGPAVHPPQNPGQGQCIKGSI